MEHFLAHACVYLLAAIVAVPVAKKLGLGSVLGYLIAGVVIGPAVMGCVGKEGSDVLHFAEFGVVMMLFVIGLELRPALLWEMRRTIFGLGTAQVVGCAALFCAVGMALGLPWQSSLAIGLALSLSSTAIVLQSLAERGQSKTPSGEAAFAVLLFQDIAVIPILAIMPLLAIASPAGAPDTAQSPEAHAAAAHAPGSHPAAMPTEPWMQALMVIGAVITVIIAGRFLLRPLFRYIAATQLRDLFTTTTLLLVFGIALLMQKVGLSPALGTFLAGVLLAESEYRHQLEADIEPFKGLLLGLFFLAVGAGIDFQIIADNAVATAGIVAGIILIKIAVVVVIARVFRLEHCSALHLGFALAQGGEFAFVLLQFAVGHAVLTPEVQRILVGSIAISMAMAPLLFMVYDRFIQPRFSQQTNQREPDHIVEHGHPVILAGFGRFGHIVGRLLRSNGFACTVLDHDPDQVETLRKYGLQSYYGDASRLDLMHAAGAEKAKLFIVAIDNEERSLQIVETVQHHFPHLMIVARAISRQHAYDLIRKGVKMVHRETLDSALSLGVDALKLLGVPEERAQRASKIFRKHDEASVYDMATISGDEQEYISRARQHIDNLEKALQIDREQADELSTAQQARPYEG